MGDCTTTITGEFLPLLEFAASSSSSVLHESHDRAQGSIVSTTDLC